MFADDAIDRGQSDAGAFEILSTVETLKDAKKFICVSHAKADAVVADVNGALAVDLRLADFDDWLRARARVLNGVGNEVAEDSLHQPRIAFDERQFAHAPIDVPLAGFGLKIGDHFADNRL